MKMYVIQTMFRIRLVDCLKLAINWKNDITICWHDVIVNFFWRFHVSLVNFSYWSKFHVNSITGSGVKDNIWLTTNTEIGKNLSCLVLPNIWRLGQVKDTKFDANVSNKSCCLLQNAQVTAFTISELLREN